MLYLFIIVVYTVAVQMQPRIYEFNLGTLFDRPTLTTEVRNAGMIGGACGTIHQPGIAHASTRPRIAHADQVHRTRADLVPNALGTLAITNVS